MTYVINLKHRVDRKEEMLEQLSKSNIDNYTIFEAIKPSLDDLNKWNINFLYPTPLWLRNNAELDMNKYKIGALGCLKSHLEILKDAVEKGYEYILILEDDTEFIFNMEYKELCSRIKPQIEYILNKYKNFGMLYFCGNHNNGVVSKVTGNLSLVKGTLTTGSYIISKKAMIKAISELNGFDREIDVYYSSFLQNDMDCFCFTPHISRQRISHSDILNKTTVYPLQSTIIYN